jgi:hypothetical protein
MNERIKELMIQSDYPAPEIALRAQKLVELIVAECANVADVYVVDGHIDIAKIIKRHFGVTE